MTGVHAKKTRPISRVACRIRVLRSAGTDGIDRAGISTCAAIGAGIGVDNELIVPLADRLDRAGGFAGTA